MSREWTDMIVGDRMAVDNEFAQRVEDSQFSRQEWGLVMTAVEFEIENPEDADRGRLVANTDNLPAVLPEMDRIAKQQRRATGGGSSSSGSDIVRGLKDILGFGSGSGEADQGRVREANELANAYARELQLHLEDNGKWADVRAAASE